MCVKNIGFLTIFSFRHSLRLLEPGQVGRVFASGLGELGSIPSRVIPKT